MIEIKIPRPGESINEVVLSKWFFPDGSLVKKDQEIGEIESDKATLPLIAPASGKLLIKVAEGSTVSVGTVACVIDDSVAVTIGEQSTRTAEKIETKEKNADVAAETPKQEIVAKSESPDFSPPQPEVSAKDTGHIKVSPLAQKLMEEHHLSLDDVLRGLRRLRKEDVEAVIRMQSSSDASVDSYKVDSDATEYRREERRPLTQLRKKLSQRLVSAKNETAMLTTFNEIDMSQVIHLRNTYQKAFSEKHGIKLGFMSFFSMAAAIALKKFPQVNSQLSGDEWIFFDYVDLGIAVQTDKGLMVPVIRNVEKMGLAEIEKEIARLAAKARNNRLSISEMEGGTFTITNGGVFGSLFSTPILNPPQAAILGMHNIVDRPVAVNGKVEIRPMMYVALSYDHRIIDGRDSVSFLVKIKELIENPMLMLIDGDNAANRLLDL
ncbi:MAG TPA: 2-oxoglutarate dehydrogenase complex dihydrolipoyllysine-residue succinyltransferase [Bacteroidales bacterium]|nr:2-oxoglutarate dehydrogenase complex dihydrolipoyllysine-residue succinyltransferase [Bacteroidales bacterium]HPO64968.1 2-oxoglutarate dehydrogenase complex dihydrolipoyllysine-residue succinyltransferase [Bacteroidales bacterium]